MDNVKECLQEAMELYVNKLGDSLIPAKDWPPSLSASGKVPGGQTHPSAA